MDCNVPLDDGGLLLSFEGQFRIKHFRVSIECGLIEMRVTGDFKTGIDEEIQYLTPSEAMMLSKALKVIALRAFEDNA